MTSPEQNALPDAARLRDLLTGTRWHDVTVVAETGSTNADLMERAAGAGSGASGIDGTVLIAGCQRAGRGRHARTWQTPPGQLAISAAVAVPAPAVDRIGWLSLVAGMAVADAVGRFSREPVDLKWPNDVLASGGGKLAGILSEYRPLAGGGVAVIGTGINVDFATAGDGSDGDFVAASVTGVAGGPVDVTEVAAAYLTALSERLASWPSDLDAQIADYRDRSATIGARVRLVLPGGREVEGRAEGIDAEGRIVVDGPGGRVVAAAGDVTHLRTS